MKNKFKLDAIILNFSALLLCFSLIYSINAAVNFNMSLVKQLLFFALIFELIFILFKKPISIFVSVIILIITVLIMLKYDRNLVISLVQSSIQFINNIIDNLRQGIPIKPQNKFPLFVVLSSILSFTSLIFFYNKRLYTILYAAFSLVLIVYWYNFNDAALTSIKILLSSFFITLSTVNFHKISRSSKNDYRVDNTKYAPFFKSTLLTIIIALLFSSILPKWNNPVDWIWFESKVVNTFPIVLSFRSNPEYVRGQSSASQFDFRTTGFSPNYSILGGKVVPNPRVVMTVKTDEPIYLRGNAKTLFNGVSWSSDDSLPLQVKSNVSFYNYLPIYNNSLIDNKKYESLKTITITNRNFASTTLFSPLFPTKVDFKYSNYIFINPDLIMYSKDGIYKNESYMVTYLKPLPYSVQFQNGLSEKKADLNNLLVYLSISDTTTLRTIDLTKKIIKNAKNDYEKAMLIENYLRSNYSYTLDVEDYNADDNPDFVDYFLFDAKEGYCTYYASAMVIMLRIAGIPSRYVEGYIVKDKLSNGEYKVSQSNAHAWVEAFIEPVGWMSFEPTPNYQSPNALDVEIEEPLEEENTELDPDILKGNTKNPNRENIIEEGREITIDDENNANLKNSPNYSVLLLLFIGLLLILRMLYLTIKYVINGKKQKKLDKNKKIEKYYYDIQHILGELGYPKYSYETYFEYSKRISYKFYQLEDIEFKKITEIFIQTKFGFRSAADEEVQLLDRFRNITINRYKNYTGKIRYFIKKYLIGSIKF